MKQLDRCRQSVREAILQHGDDWRFNAKYRERD